MPSCSQHWGKVPLLLSRCNNVSALPQMCCRKGQGLQTDTQTQLCSAFFSLPFAVTSVCCKQELLLLRTGLPFTVIHSTRSSHSVVSSFFFPPLPVCIPGTAEVVPEAQLGTRDRLKKKPEQLLQAELHLAGGSSSTRNRWASWSPKAVISL